MERLAAIKRKYEHQLMELEGVVGVGIGISALGKPCIKAYLRRKSPDLVSSIPPKLDDVDVEIEEVGDVTAF